MLIDVNICVNRVNKCQKEVNHICSFKWSELSYQENKSNYSSFKGNWIDLGRENNGRTLIIYILNNIDQVPFPLILYYDGGISFPAVWTVNCEDVELPLTALNDHAVKVNEDNKGPIKG